LEAAVVLPFGPIFFQFFSSNPEVIDFPKKVPDEQELIGVRMRSRQRKKV